MVARKDKDFDFFIGVMLRGSTTGKHGQQQYTKQLDFHIWEWTREGYLVPRANQFGLAKQGKKSGWQRAWIPSAETSSLPTATTRIRQL
jgi:hypothetical protein